MTEAQILLAEQLQEIPESSAQERRVRSVGVSQGLGGCGGKKTFGVQPEREDFSDLPSAFGSGDGRSLRPRESLLGSRHACNAGCWAESCRILGSGRRRRSQHLLMQRTSLGQVFGYWTKLSGSQLLSHPHHTLKPCPKSVFSIRSGPAPGCPG